jgi:hypothetical protein
MAGGMLGSSSTVVAAMILGVAAAGVPVSAQAAQLALTWSDNSTNEDGFLVERRSSTGGFASVGAVGPDVVTFLDSGLQAGADYCYRVRAFNSVGTTPYTNEVCGTAAGGGAPPSAPLSVSLNQSTFSRTDTLITTVLAVSGVIATPVDAYIVLNVGSGFLSLQLDGRLVPGLVPIARGIVLPSVSAPFTFPLAGAPPGAYTWLAAVTTPGTLTLVSPLASTPFTIVP